MASPVVEKWNSLTLVQKVLLIVGLPLVLVMLFTQTGRTILAFLEEKTRSKVDEKSAAMDQEIKEQEAETNKAQGRLDQIKKDKADAVQKAKDDDVQEAVNFWNSRPGSPDK